MARKKQPPTSPDVISLDSARKRRELQAITANINALTKAMTDGIAEAVDAYHRWEADNPDKTVSQGDKLEMVGLGFVGSAGFARCQEEHRLPIIAFHGSQAEHPSFSDLELSEVAMCPALESGRCQGVLEALSIPPCVLLGGEIQQLLAPGYVSELGDAVAEGGWRDSPEEEKRRFARAKALVRKHRKLEEEAERRKAKTRRPRPT